MKKPASHIKRRLLFTLFSWITATTLLFVSYSVTNIGFSISGEADIIKQSNFIFKELLQHESSVPDSILFVNVCYDKQLANIYDEDGFEIGNVDITDRHSLLRFLNILSRRNDYKYVILDVFFEDGIKTEYDSALYARIASMERIVILMFHVVRIHEEQAWHDSSRNYGVVSPVGAVGHLLGVYAN